ncbi:hypothetical protein LOK49_Contig40G00020 [Camellia lanceoleosa]|nr:hypothetical protein LOK49_Contig40G00020 [Camellia lanceoleosa]
MTNGVSVFPSSYTYALIPFATTYKQSCLCLSCSLALLLALFNPVQSPLIITYNCFPKFSLSNSVQSPRSSPSPPWSFNLENALASHRKAKHSAGQYMDLKRELLSSDWKIYA